MISTQCAAWFRQRNIHYGWVVAATTFLTMLSTAGAMGSAGVMIGPLQQEFGWTTAEISSAMAIRLVLFGLFGPFAAAFMNHFGVKKVVACALALIASGLLLSFFMTELWQLLLLWGVVVGIGTGMTALVLGATVATRWFSKRRGLVVGLLTASNATGQLVFLPLLASLTEDHGWRFALGVIVAFITLTMLLVLALMRDNPADVQLPLYGESEVAPLQNRSTQLSSLLLAPLQNLRDISRTGTFWVLFLSFYVCGFSTNGLIHTHWIPMNSDFGVAAVGAASMLALIGLFDFVGTILSGWLSDRFDNRWLLFWFYGLRGLSLIFLSFSGFGTGALLVFAIFYGLDWVATVPPTVKLTAQRYGAQTANMTFGWIFAGHQIGAATAAYVAGVMRTDLETYMPALQLAGALCIMAALVVLAIRSRAVHTPPVAI
ncbi:MAG: MFS transporter [Gammaproteobacteria bacterium RIFCSPLOWO2_02_FULL_57_10]|nr:MAG: MFS transporter [Gammaproteobacteria bacterium RIFCSPLOWO2_02_FULL_57_10]